MDCKKLLGIMVAVGSLPLLAVAADTPPESNAGVQSEAAAPEKSAEEDLLIDELLGQPAEAEPSPSDSAPPEAPVNAGAPADAAAPTEVQSPPPPAAEAETLPTIPVATKETAPSPAPRQGPSRVIEEIVVTAGKREQAISDVAGSVTALGADQMKDIGAAQLQDLTAYAPGLTATSSGTGSNQVVLRGVSTGAQASPTVGIYIDETPIGSATSYANGAYAADVNVFDLSRVEVLNGPQGTLYGASTLGGLLKYVTQRPDMESWHARIETEGAQVEEGATRSAARGMLNVPLTSLNTGVRASVSYTRDPGFIDNPGRDLKNVNAAEVDSQRISTLTNLSENLDLSLSYMDQRITRDGMANSDRDVQTGRPVEGELDQSVVLDEDFLSQVRVATGVITWDMGWAELVSASSWQETHTYFTFDATHQYGAQLMSGNLIPYLIRSDNETRKITQELRLTTEEGEWFDWQAGLFLTQEDSKNLSEIKIGSNADRRDLVGSLLDRLLQIIAPEGSLLGVELFSGRILSTFKETAGFGSGTLHLGDRFDLTVGARVGRQEIDYAQYNRGVVSNPTNPNQAAPEFGNFSDTVATYLINPRYVINDHTQVYFRAASGYRPGGPNYITRNAAGQPVGNKDFESDSLWNYEVGLKWSSPDQTASAELAVYHIDWKNIQLLANINGLFHLLNAGRANIDGIEAAGQYVTPWGLRLRGSGSFTDARLAEASEELDADKGARLPTTPRYSGALLADYPMQLGSMDMTFGVNYRYVGERNAGFDGSTLKPQYHLPSYSLVDLRVSLAATSNPGWDLSFFVKNLFNEGAQVYADMSAVASDDQAPARVTITEPRSVGLSLSVSIGE